MLFGAVNERVLLKHVQPAAGELAVDATPLDATPFQPAILLFLDGMNEITADHIGLIREIRVLAEDAKGSQIIITSRFDINYNWATAFETITLLPLTTEKIKTYLIAHQLQLPEDKTIEQLLHNPMMLTLYAASSRLLERHLSNDNFEFKPQITSYSELMWNYKEAQLVKYFENDDIDTRQYYYYKLLIRHILPYIGYEMEKTGIFEIKEKTLKALLKTHCPTFLEDNFLDTFEEYEDYIDDYNLETPKRKDLNELLEFLTERLLMMVEENKTYRFLHQHFRDFFAASYIINDLTIHAYHQTVPTTLSERKLTPYSDVRKNIGELCGEQYYQFSYLKTATGVERIPPTLLSQSLKPCKGIFHQKAIQNVVWNILTIFKNSRGHLADLDLSNLDLREFFFYDVPLHHYWKKHYYPTSLDGSLLNLRDFLFQGHQRWVRCVCYSTDGTKLLSGSDDATIKVWDVTTGKRLRTLRGHQYSILVLDYHPTEEKAISCSTDSTIKEWDLTTGNCLQTLEGHESSIKSVCYSSNGQLAVSGGNDKTIKIWDLQKGLCTQTLEGHQKDINDVLFFDNDQQIASCSNDKTIKIWEVATGKCIETIEGHNSAIYTIAIHPTKQQLISAAGKTIKMWDITSRKCLQTFHGHKKWINSVSYSLDGQRIVSAANDKTVKEWDTTTGQCLQTLKGHDGWVSTARYHKDGQRILSCSNDKTIKEWHTATGQCLQTFEGHASWITSVCFSLDSQLLILGARDGTIKIWDIASGRCLQTLEGHRYGVNKILYHPNQSQLLSGSDEGDIK